MQVGNGNFILTECCSRLELRLDYSWTFTEDLVVALSSHVPFLLSFQRPVCFRRSIVIVPADLVESLHVRVNRKDRSCEGRLDTNIFIATGMPHLLNTNQSFVVFGVPFLECGGGGQAIHK